MTIINNEIIKAIDLIWNNKFEDAEKIFEKHSNTTPRYSLHNAETSFLKSFITANEIETEIAIKRLKETKELSEQCIKQFESNKIPLNYEFLNNNNQDIKNHILDCKIVLGDSLYMLAVLQITRDQKFKGCLNLRKSWKIFEETLKQINEDEKNGIFKYSKDLTECLRFGCGFFYFSISIIPQKYLKFVELVGFKADREQGLFYIRECLNNNRQGGGIRTPFATMVLLFNNLILPRGLYNPIHQLNEAQQLIEKNLEKYPSGSLFHVMGSHCYKKQTKIDMGIHCMEIAISNYLKTVGSTTTTTTTTTNHIKKPLIFKYELACFWCIKSEWNKAIEIFEELIKEDKFQIRPLCALQLASCYMMNDQRENAISTLQILIKQYCKKSSSVDTVIQRQAQRYLLNGGHFSAFEILYIRRDIAKMDKSIALKTLDELNLIAKKTNVFEFKLNKILNQDNNNNNNNNQISLSQSQQSIFTKTISNLIKKKDETIIQENLINDRASYLMLKGAIFKSIDLIDQSMECFEELLSMSHLITEKFYIPYSLYEMSESYYQKRNQTKSLEFILKCNKISNYDWSDPLKVRLRVTLDQLKRDSNNNKNENGASGGGGCTNNDDLFVGDFNDEDLENLNLYDNNEDCEKEVFYLNDNKMKPNNNNNNSSSYNTTPQFKSNVILPSPSVLAIDKRFNTNLQL